MQRRPGLRDPVLCAGAPEGGEVAVEGREVGESHGGCGWDGRVDGEVRGREGVREGVVELCGVCGGERGEEGAPGLAGEGACGEERERRVERPVSRGGVEECGDFGGRGVGVEEGGECGGECVGWCAGGGNGVRGDDADGVCVGREAEDTEHGGGVGGGREREGGRQGE